MEVLDAYEFRFADLVTKCGGLSPIIDQFKDDKEIMFKLEITLREILKTRDADIVKIMDAVLHEKYDRYLSDCDDDSIEKEAKRGNPYAQMSIHFNMGHDSEKEVDDEKDHDFYPSLDLPGVLPEYIDWVTKISDKHREILISRAEKNDIKAIECLAIYDKDINTQIIYSQKLYDITKKNNDLWQLVRLYSERNDKGDLEKAMSIRPCKCSLKLVIEHDGYSTKIDTVKEKYPNVKIELRWKHGFSEFMILDTLQEKVVSDEIECKSNESLIEVVTSIIEQYKAYLF